MLIDSRDLDRGQVIQSDLCIIGAGAAGIALARALRSTGVSIALLESGGLTYDERTQSLYEGQAVGPLFGEGNEYLRTSRLRYFGGTTNHWTGACRPLDPIDFAAREWVPHSGWPITRAELDRYYDAAAEVVQTSPFTARDEGLDLETAPLLFPNRSVIPKRFHFSRPTRFGIRYRQELADSPNVAVYLHATVIRIEASTAGSRVDRVRVVTPGGNRLAVTSRHFVLATGGIENARLLLNSNDVQTKGLGNETDLVGRFFMDHLGRQEAGGMLLASPLADPSVYFDSQVRLCISEELQREHRLRNASVRLYLRERQDTPPSTARLGQALATIDHLGETEWAGTPTFAACGVITEPSPNPESRVTLGDDLDELGMRRAKLDWRVNRSDLDNIGKTMEVLAVELGKTNRGRVQVASIDESDPWRGMDYDLHHIGTTRMSQRLLQGVVDSDCRVYGLANLYIAGSSVFPTSGFANPTLTIVALTLRLSEHLRAVMRRG